MCSSRAHCMSLWVKWPMNCTAVCFFFSASQADAHAHVLQLCRHLLYVFLNRFCKSVKLQQFTILTGNFLSSTVAGEDFERRSVAMETCSHQRPGRAASLDGSLSRYINS